MSDEGSVGHWARQSDLVHEQLRDSPIKRWVLLDGNRYFLAFIVSFVIFLTGAILGLTGFIPVTQPGTATTLVSAIVGGTLPFITIVLAINQLVLSQELDWPGNLADRFDAMVSHRREVESATQTPVSPAAPADFLQLLVDTVVKRVNDLEDDASHVSDSQQELVRDFVSAVTDEGRVVSDSLDHAEFGTFDALSAVLGHFNGAHLYAARWIQYHLEEPAAEDIRPAFDEIIELLSLLAVARQTFKTLYMQYELSHLSTLLLVVGFPALLGGGIFMMTYPVLIERIGSTTGLVLLVSLVVTLVFLPFTVLLVYTLRIATIASRTADFGPFVPRVHFHEEEQ